MINDDYDSESSCDEEDLDEEEGVLVVVAAAAAAVAATVAITAHLRARNIALDGVKECLDTISNSLRDLASERQRQLDARGEQVGEAERRHEAMQRVRQETHLDASRATALADLVAMDAVAADIYMSIEREDHRHAWVVLKLKEMGFVDGISI